MKPVLYIFGLCGSHDEDRANEVLDRGSDKRRFHNTLLHGVPKEAHLGPSARPGVRETWRGLTEAYPGRDQFDGSSYAQLSRFITDDVKARFACSSPLASDRDGARYGGSAAKSKKVREKIEGLWS